jgi:hypothetical protein
MPICPPRARALVVTLSSSEAGFIGRKSTTDDVTSTRGKQLRRLHRRMLGRAVSAGIFSGRERSFDVMTQLYDHRSAAGDSGDRSSGARTKFVAARWATIVYVVVALAAPLLIYAGPDLVSPATAIANAALDDGLSLRTQPGRPMGAADATSQPTRRMFF